MTFIPHKFLSVLFGNLAILPYASLTKYAVICLSVLSFVGCGYLWFQFKNRSIAIILFYFAYIIFHSLYPSVIPEYTLNVQWIGHIFIFAGAAFISSLVPDKNVISTFLSKLSIRSVRILAISSTWLIILLYVIKQGVASYGGILFGSIAVAYFMHIWDFHIKLDTIKVLIVLIAVLFAIRQDALTRKKLFHLKYAKAEYRLVGEWYKDNYRPGDRMVINQPTIANYYSNLKKSDYIAFSEFKSTNMDDFIQELGEKKASFMAVVYHDNPQDKESDGIYQWRYKYQKLYLLEQLFDGQSYGHFELLEKLTAGHRWAYIYRIQRHDNYFTNGEYKSESAH
ncbi:hypothetical protein JXA02_02060 [candidate division KSB1 bacterium]|nr:hypothetical protein [candidate division KSB1 bacterium]RQW10491.1 MAG: hypothetical protein EH222_02255 [candidate division KSB1 bacterium]